MKSVIKQIRKIKGIITVEPFGANGAVVLFEVEEQKPKSLTPEELVDGRIYVDGKDERIFRFNKLNGHKKAIMYSQLIRNFNNGTCLNSTDGYSLEGSKIRCSSIIESKELIKFEIERDYFHELK